MNEEKPIIAERIKFLRKEKGYTQEQLADLLGLSAKSSIANYESGANAPSDEIKAKMCEVFDCSMDYLMGKSNFKTKKEELTNYLDNEIKITVWQTLDSNYYEYVVPCELKEDDINKLIDILLPINKDDNITPAYKIQDNLKEYLNRFGKEKKEKIIKLIQIILDEIINISSRRNAYYSLKNSISNNDSKQFYMCPVYGRISAGQPNWAEECIEGRIPIDPNYMNITEPTECFFLRVNGESMNKEIKNGAYALIRKTDWVENGEIAVVLVNGYDATLKKFSQQGDLIILEPMSNDPSFTTQVYGKDTEIKIIGKYIGKMEMK